MASSQASRSTCSRPFRPASSARLSTRRRLRAEGCPAPSHGLRARAVAPRPRRAGHCWCGARRHGSPRSGGLRRLATAPGRGSYAAAHLASQARLGSASSLACSASVPSRASPALHGALVPDAEPPGLTWDRPVRARRLGDRARRRCRWGPRAGRDGPSRAAPLSKWPPGAPSIRWRRSQAAHARSRAARRRPTNTSWRSAAWGRSGTDRGPAAAPQGRKDAPSWRAGVRQQALLESCVGATRDQPRRDQELALSITCSSTGPRQAAMASSSAAGSSPTSSSRRWTGRRKPALTAWSKNCASGR